MLKRFKKYMGTREERHAQRATAKELSKQRKYEREKSGLTLELADMKRREEIALMRSRVSAKRKRIDRLQAASGSRGGLFGSIRKYGKNIGRPGSLTVPSLGSSLGQSEPRRGAKRRKRRKKLDPIGELVGF